MDVRLDPANVAEAVAPVRQALLPLAVLAFGGSAMVAGSNIYRATRRPMRNGSYGAANREAAQLFAVGAAIVIPLALYLRRNMGAAPTQDLDDAGPRGRPSRYDPNEERY